MGSLLIDQSRGFRAGRNVSFKLESTIYVVGHRQGHAHGHEVGNLQRVYYNFEGSMGWTILIIVIIVVIFAAVIIGIYNRLVNLRNQVKNAWSQIDVQLQRRYDLIPNLVETVKGYMTFEQTTLQKVIEARNQAQAARTLLEKQGGPTAEGASLKELIGAETSLRGALGGIFALSENYPTLRATENMQRLQEELSSTENKVAFARQAYNDSVMLYNTKQQEFPTNLVASLFNHHPADLFVIEEPEAKQAVKVKF